MSYPGIAYRGNKNKHYPVSILGRFFDRVGYFHSQFLPPLTYPTLGMLMDVGLMPIDLI